jgi:hypothetical protein
MHRDSRRESAVAQLFTLAAMYMTRQEFITKRAKQQKITAACSLIALVILFAPVGFMAWLEPRRGDLPRTFGQS